MLALISTTGENLILTILEKNNFQDESKAGFEQPCWHMLIRYPMPGARYAEWAVSMVHITKSDFNITNAIPMGIPSYWTFHCTVSYL